MPEEINHTSQLAVEAFLKHPDRVEFSDKYTEPPKKPISEVTKIINNRLINFCQNHNLILPNFIRNLLDIYQDYPNTKGQVESRGIIQLYTVYFILHLISAYWYSIKNLKNSLVSGRKHNTNIITHLLGKKGVNTGKYESMTREMRKEITKEIDETYK